MGHTTISKYSWNKIDRLAVIATSHTVNKFLDVSEIIASTSLEISSAVYEFINNWGLINSIQVLVFDTKASNIATFNATSSLLEKKIDPDILVFGCCYHTYEIIL